MWDVHSHGKHPPLGLAIKTPASVSRPREIRPAPIAQLVVRVTLSVPSPTGRKLEFKPGFIASLAAPDSQGAAAQKQARALVCDITRSRVRAPMGAWSITPLSRVAWSFLVVCELPDQNLGLHLPVTGPPPPPPPPPARPPALLRFEPRWGLAYHTHSRWCGRLFVGEGSYQIKTLTLSHSHRPPPAPAPAPLLCSGSSPDGGFGLHSTQQKSGDEGFFFLTC